MLNRNWFLANFHKVYIVAFGAQLICCSAVLSDLWNWAQAGTDNPLHSGIRTGVLVVEGKERNHNANAIALILFKIFCKCGNQRVKNTSFNKTILVIKKNTKNITNILIITIFRVFFLPVVFSFWHFLYVVSDLVVFLFARTALTTAKLFSTKEITVWNSLHKKRCQYIRLQGRTNTKYNTIQHL